MGNQQDRILLAISNSQVVKIVERYLTTAGYPAVVVQDIANLRETATAGGVSLVILDEGFLGVEEFDLASELVENFPAIPLVLLVERENAGLHQRALQAGLAGTLPLHFEPEDLLSTVSRVLHLANRRKEAIAAETQRSSSALQRQVNELESLMRLGRQVTSSLSVDGVLEAIVDAAVELTGAEEGSLLLIDESTGDLYMRASRNFQEEFVRTFRLPVTHSLAGEVIRSGKAILLNEKTPQKIKTAYLVRSLLYVPLQLQGHVFGVLGVDNRQSRLSFSDGHVQLMNTLASFAVIALENARLYSEASSERNKLETILGNIQDGVIVIDQDFRLVMVNKAAREVFHLDFDAPLEGKTFGDVFPHPELMDLVTTSDFTMPGRTEIAPEEDRVYNVSITPVAGVGRVMTLSDISGFRRVDRIKSDFVHTVSHDLRSPLTAILGYVELIERAGPVNDMQRDFIRRVQASVYNITGLIDQLVELGRIESGLDARKEKVFLDQIIHYSADGLKRNLSEKGHHLEIILPGELPPIQANPVQMRQMMDHLLDNAIRYTGPEGTITVKGILEGDQVILQVRDTGIGIPAADLPFIFDKFYRAANAGAGEVGSGLGLAIVKSIVENHSGRIWVEATHDKGSTFTVVLPIMSGSSGAVTNLI